jgi:hypothetical protein
MSTAAAIVAVLAFAGAVASWIVGAIFYVRTLQAIGGPDRARTRWLAVIAWPLARKRLTGAAVEHAARVNKALVAFFACLMVAAAATSAATNMSRFSR